ncbi:uncharacterized protein EAF01_010800 [Botrytis porri]|uniref:uncharacterized protein n=1 Tax=Botrytis porri TaxID=87229 RepID=UPI0019017ABA|nr:uncharacterized protein EAF01_010800 [Botrytis porri]KAF7889307.1 hypothetical protein EAF01_010800 [Botrytis porri]
MDIVQLEHLLATLWVNKQPYLLLLASRDIQKLANLKTTQDYAHLLVISIIVLTQHAESCQILSTPSVSPFDPLACTSGLGVGNLGGLCDFTCNFGYCPLHSCSCGSKGNLAALPSYTPMVAKPASGLDESTYGDLCQFACEYGFCPPEACGTSTEASETVYVDQIIFVEPSPVFVCPPPCTFVMPSSTMNSETVITFPPISKSTVVGGSTLLSCDPFSKQVNFSPL